MLELDLDLDLDLDLCDISCIVHEYLVLKIIDQYVDLDLESRSSLSRHLIWDSHFTCRSRSRSRSTQKAKKVNFNLLML